MEGFPSGNTLESWYDPNNLSDVAELLVINQWGTGTGCCDTTDFLLSPGSDSFFCRPNVSVHSSTGLYRIGAHFQQSVSFLALKVRGQESTNLPYYDQISEPNREYIRLGLLVSIQLALTRILWSGCLCCCSYSRQFPSPRFVALSRNRTSFPLQWLFFPFWTIQRHSSPSEGCRQLIHWGNPTLCHNEAVPVTAIFQLPSTVSNETIWQITSIADDHQPGSTNNFSGS